MNRSNAEFAEVKVSVDDDGCHDSDEHWALSLLLLLLLCTKIIIVAFSPIDFKDT